MSENQQKKLSSIFLKDESGSAPSATISSGKTAIIAAYIIAPIIWLAAEFFTLFFIEFEMFATRIAVATGLTILLAVSIVITYIVSTRRDCGTAPEKNECREPGFDSLLKPIHSPIPSPVPESASIQTPPLVSGNNKEKPTMYLDNDVIDSQTELLLEEADAAAPSFTLYIEVEGVKSSASCSKIPCVIGRNPKTSDIVINDPSVSRNHARLDYSGTLTISSLNDANGVLVNGTKIAEPTRIDEKDVIKLGRAVVRIKSV